MPDPPIRRQVVRVGAAHDPAEQHADQLAAQALSLSDEFAHKGHDGAVRRAAADSLAGELELDSAALKAAGGSPSRLDPATEQRMSQGFGRDLSGVRVHTGSAAANLASELGAKAFTHGNDIYFGAGQYKPGSPAGDHVLAHELAHTAQNADGVHRYPDTWITAPVPWAAQTAAVRRPGAGISGGVYILTSRPNTGPVQTAVVKPTFGKNAANIEETGSQIVAADRLMREFGLNAPQSRLVKRGTAEFNELLGLCRPFAPARPAQGQPGYAAWEPLDNAQDLVVMSEIVNATTLMDVARGAGNSDEGRRDLLRTVNNPEIMHDIGLMMVADIVAGNGDRFVGEAKNLGNVMISVLNGKRSLNVFDTTAMLPRLKDVKGLLGNVMMSGINVKFSAANPDKLMDEVLEAIVQVVEDNEPRPDPALDPAPEPFSARLRAAFKGTRALMLGWYMDGWNEGIAKATELSQGDRAQQTLGDLDGERNVHAETLKAVATFVSGAGKAGGDKDANNKAAAVALPRLVAELDTKTMWPEGGIVGADQWIKVPSAAVKAEWVDNPSLPAPADVLALWPTTDGAMNEAAYGKMKYQLLQAQGTIKDVLPDKKRMGKSQPRNRAELGRAIVGAEALAAGAFRLTYASYQLKAAANTLKTAGTIAGQLPPQDASAIAAKTETVNTAMDYVERSQGEYAAALTDAARVVPKTSYPDKADLSNTLTGATNANNSVATNLASARKAKLGELATSLRRRANAPQRPAPRQPQPV